MNTNEPAHPPICESPAYEDRPDCTNPCEHDGSCDHAAPLCEEWADAPFCSGPSMAETNDGDEVPEHELTTEQVIQPAQHGAVEQAELAATGPSDGVTVLLLISVLLIVAGIGLLTHDGR